MRVSSYWTDRIQSQIDLLARIREDQTLLDSIQHAALLLCETLEKEGKVLLCGNGGSAADAQHLATELVSKFFKERQALDAEALTVNTSTLTAIGNDYSFDRVFSRQVEAKGRPGDVLIGISTSGNSRNVIEAMTAAKSRGMRTIAFIGGNDKGEMHRIADCRIAVPSLTTPRIQEAHILIGHMICEFVEARMCECSRSPRDSRRSGA